MPDSKSYFDFLNKKIKILVIDDKPDTAQSLALPLSEYRLFDVEIATTVTSAEEMIRNDTYHVCLRDLSVKDSTKNPFYLLNKYGRAVPFIIVSGTADLNAVFTAAKCGARAAYSKPVDFSKMDLIHEIKQQFISTFLFPCEFIITDSLVENCFNILIEQGPETVGIWAEMAGIDETYLRRKWHLWFNASPKHSLYLVKCFTNAFRIIDAEYQGLSVYSVNKEDYKKTHNYYLQNSEQLNAILSKNVSKKNSDPILFCEILKVKKNVMTKNSYLTR